MLDCFGEAVHNKDEDGGWSGVHDKGTEMIPHDNETKEAHPRRENLNQSSFMQVLSFFGLRLLCGDGAMNALFLSILIH